MKKKWFVMLVAAVLLLSSCSEEGQITGERTIEESGLNVYLVNRTNDALVEVTIDVDKTSVDTQLEDILLKLYEGTGDEAYLGTIPESDLIEGYELMDYGVRLHMKPLFEDLDDISMLICRSSIIKSVTAIDGIDYVEFYIDGLPMKDDNGKVYGAFYPADIITASEVINEELTTRSVLLYYPEDQGLGLIQVKSEIELYPSDSLERELVEALMTVPPGYGVESPLPEDTQVKNVHTKDGICYVDFNESFRINHYGGSTGEMLTVYSVVNTLTELPDISRVQFLIEGEKTDFFKGHLDFSQLFEYNIELITE